MKQYLPKKPLKREFKFRVRAEAPTGFFCDFQVFCDNFFTTSKFLELLLDKGVYACGTTRPSQQGFPEDLKGLKLQRGEYAFHQKGSLVAPL